MQAEPTHAARPIRVRKMDFPFADADVPRWWFHDNPLVTHGANGLNLLFPEGERFFIRSVKHYMDRIEDPE
ncbi:MAG: metal-dependent hydrolase, partial [Myxococcales bacterium]|nr:metal-dependent hydrolase [Myxococcales bacterium]